MCPSLSVRSQVVIYSVPQQSVVLHCPEEETELLDGGGVGVCQGQLSWVMCESPPFAEGGDWLLGSGGHSLEVPGKNGAGGLSHPSGSW